MTRRRISSRSEATTFEEYPVQKSSSGKKKARPETGWAFFVIDEKRIVRYVDIHDINKRPPLDDLIKELKKLKK